MLTNYVNNLSNLVNQFVPIYQTILDTINNPNEISNIYQLLDNITEEYTKIVAFWFAIKFKC